MSLYRCAVCGSSHVARDEKREGYSIAKGVVGTALLGNAGAVMGINGKRESYYHCSDCGQTLSYSMPISIKEEIDKYLLNPEKNEMFLKIKKKTYPNIEWSENSKNTLNGEVNMISDSASPEEIADAMWRYYEKTKIPYISSSDIAKAIMGKWGVIPYEAEKILEEKGLMTQEKVEDGIEKEYYYTFYSDVNDIKRNIDKIRIDKIIREIVRRNWDEIEKIFIFLTNKYKEKITENEFKNEFFEMIVEKKYSNEEKVNRELANFSLNRLEKNHFFKVIDENVVFISNEERQKIVEERKKSFEEERNKQKEEFERKIAEEVKNSLMNKDRVTIAELQAESSVLNEYSNVKLSVILKKLCDKGIFEQEVFDKITYYQMPGTKERLEKEEVERKKKIEEEKEQYNKEVDEFNLNKKNQINDLKSNIEKEQIIINENKSKIFGEGAKIKKIAKQKIIDYENQIRKIESELKQHKI